MTRDRLQTAIHAGVPFVIKMADGEKYEVADRYRVALGRTSARHRSAKALKGFGGRSVLELVETHDGNTYRASITDHAFLGATPLSHCFLSGHVHARTWAILLALLQSAGSGCTLSQGGTRRLAWPWVEFPWRFQRIEPCPAVEGIRGMGWSLGWKFSGVQAKRSQQLLQLLAINMKTTRIRIDGMTCLNCVRHVQKALEAVQGVKRADVKLDEAAIVEHDDKVPDTELLRAVKAAGGYRGEIA